ncbi:MAG: hypothetical protein M3444_06635 [Acidobacteriota bacterium]|nr:hypothetical protein [Acidobacteriota bacterium]MDQ5837798.1 hypothetical protein [Acidobacteriota bacterium]
MKFFKFLLLFAVLIFAVWGTFALFGLLAVLLKWLLILGVVALAGVGAYKLLSKPDDERHLELSSAEREMQQAERMLAELRRRELTK